MFPVQNGFLLSGQVFVGNVGPYMQPGMAANPLAFFTILNKHGYATGIPAIQPIWLLLGGPVAPLHQVSACLGGTQ